MNRNTYNKIRTCLGRMEGMAAGCGSETMADALLMWCEDLTQALLEDPVEELTEEMYDLDDLADADDCEAVMSDLKTKLQEKMN